MSRQIWPLAWSIVIAFGASAAAQDLSAGKSPAQLFASDCSACHKSAQGLARGKDPSSLAGFLREHYTTKPQNAGALAGYLASVGGRAPAEPSRQRPATAARPDEAKPPERNGAAERARHAPDGVSETTAARPRPGEAARPAPMNRAERMKLYATSGDRSRPDERGESERRSEDPAARLQGYAASGADAEGVGRDAAANGNAAGEKAPRTRSRAARAAEPAAAPVPAEVAPGAPDATPTPAGESPAPPPSSAPPSAQPSEESR